MPVTASVQYLSDMRLNPGKELICVLFTFGNPYGHGEGDSQAQGEENEWERLVGYHVERE